MYLLAATVLGIALLNLSLSTSTKARVLREASREASMVEEELLEVAEVVEDGAERFVGKAERFVGPVMEALAKEATEIESWDEVTELHGSSSGSAQGGGGGHLGGDDDLIAARNSGGGVGGSDAAVAAAGGESARVAAAAATAAAAAAVAAAAAAAAAPAAAAVQLRAAVLRRRREAAEAALAARREAEAAEEALVMDRPTALPKNDQGDVWAQKERAGRLPGADPGVWKSTAPFRGPFATSIPDTRNSACRRAPLSEFTRGVPGGGQLAHFSVVIPYHREALLTMGMTIKSILANSPAALLDEIIFVDDDNRDPALKQQLLRYPKVRVVSTARRIGLIAAKNLGASEVRSAVVIFLESHVQTNVFWAEYLLARLAACPACVVLPVTDIIDDTTLAYNMGGDGVRGGFGWDLTFKWISNPPPEAHYRVPQPLATPAMSGGLLAMTMKEWDRLGHYDGRMEVWGGENVEMSLRVWRCGGRVEIIPCSRVGHVYRSPKNYQKWKDNFPYSFPKGAGVTVEHNNARLAKVWLEEPFLQRYYRRAPNSARMNLDVRGRLALKRRLQCKSMRWYLKNVYPELGQQK